MGYSIAYNSGTTTPFGTFKQGTITMGLKPQEYTVSSGFTWYANAEYLNDGYLIISDTYSQGWSTQSESKPTIWRSATGTTESFVSLVNQLPDVNGVTGFTDSGSAMGYLQSTGKYFVSKDEYLGIVTDGLVLNLDAGWYPSYSGSGTTWKDLSGLNNGTLTNGPTFNSNNGGSIVFDGTDDYIIIPNSNTVSFSDNLTIGSWFNLDSYGPGSYGAIVSKRGDGTQFGINYNQSGNFLNCYYESGSGFRSTTVTLNNNFPLNTWIYIVATYTKSGGNTITKIYKNSSILTTNTNQNNIQGNSTNITIGRSGGAGEYIDGFVSITQLYNRALTDSEILQNFNAQKGRFGL